MSKMNVIKMSVIMIINWIFIFIYLNQTQLSYLDHSTFFFRTILLPLRILGYIKYQNQGQIKVIKIDTDKIKVIKINVEMSKMKVIKML